MAEFILAAEAKEALDDAAVAIEQHGIWQAAIVICGLHAAAAHEDREGRPEFAHERAHLAVAHVIRNRGDGEASVSEVLVQLSHVREFLPTRLAPGCPEIHPR